MTGTEDRLPDGRGFRTQAPGRFVISILAIAASWLLAASLEATPPDPGPCLRAFYEVRTWLDAGDFPRVDADRSELVVPDCSAVGVLLRLDGRVVGRGLDTISDSRSVRRAAGRALSQALGDRVIRSLPRAVRDSAGSRLALEMEFAGLPSPIVASSLGSAATRIRPGIDGILIRRGELEAIAMPGRLLATGTADATSSTLLRLIDELGLPPRDLQELRRIDPVDLGRFETIRIGQNDTDAEPGVRRRSGPIVRDGSLDLDALQDVQTLLTARLLRWRPSADPRAGATEISTRPWFGDFDPVANRHVPFDAPLRDRLLATWALASVGSESIAPGDLDLPERENLDEEIADLGLLAAIAFGDEPRIEAWLSAVRDQPPPTGPLALARRAAAISGAGRALIDDDEVIAAHEAAWKACDSVSKVMAGFDWLAIAEARFSDRFEGTPSPRAVSLRAIRDALLARQIADGDEAGGIPLLAGARESIDARTLRPMLAMATLHGLPGEDEDTSARAREGLTGLVRLLRQLMMSEEEASELPGGGRGLGGVSMGLADARQPLAATATASLILQHLIRAEDGSERP